MPYTLGNMASISEISMLDDFGSPTPNYGTPASPAPSAGGGTDWTKQLGSLIGAAGQAASQVMGAMNQYPGNQVNPGGYPPTGYNPYANGINQWSQPGQVGVDAYGRPINAAGQVISAAPSPAPATMIPGQVGVNAFGQPIHAAGQVLPATTALTATTTSSFLPIALGLGALGILLVAMK